MKTHTKKQKKHIKKHRYTKKNGGFSGPIDYIKKHASRAKSDISASASNSLANAKEKETERGNRRMKYARGQLGDKFRSLGHTISNIDNPIVTAYQYIEKYVFGWGVPAKVKPPFIPKHKKVSFKQFLKSDIPELTEKANEKKEEKQKKEEEEKKKKEEEEKKKEAEEKKKDSIPVPTQVPVSTQLPIPVVNK